jgi:hypothetical protein
MNFVTNTHEKNLQMSVFETTKKVSGYIQGVSG